MATDTVILTDNEGNYYLLSRALIEQAKVTDSEQKAELEGTAKGGDTSGFSTYATFSPIQFGASQFRFVGACACNFQFDRAGILTR